MQERNNLSSVDAKINSLKAEFDLVLAEMQGPGTREQMQTAFNASSKELGKIAVVAARKQE